MPKFHLSTAVLCVGLFSGVYSQLALAEKTLPRLSLDIEQITLSGLSSGGFMANQMHLAYSDWVSGVGLIATGPYYCAQNSIFTALASCINKTEPPANLATLNQKISSLSQAGDLGPLDQLKDDKVWMLSGTNDRRVIQKVADQLHEQYSSLVNEDNLVYINDKPFAHHFPTIGNGSDCSTSEAPFVGNCGYDAAGEILNHVTKNLEPRVKAKSSNLFSFSQTFLAGDLAKGLGETGYVYIPASCQQGESCDIHVNFHGCNQYADTVGTDYIEQNGLNDWAESNHLVVLYPQTKQSSINPLNPQGCWDWWGYTDEHYATRKATQIRAVRKMILTLAENN
jgi:poly(3-hydroxybutyrate) depolymerase